MRHRLISRISAVLLAFVMVFSVMPQLTGSSSAAEKAKLTIVYKGTSHVITEKQWNSLFSEKAEKHYYSSREKTQGTYDGYEYKEYEGVRLADVLEAAGVDADSISEKNVVVFKGADGYSQKLEAKKLLYTKLYAFDDTGEAAAEPQEVPAMISADENGRLVFGQTDAADFNKYHWVKKMFSGTVTIEPSGEADDPYIISTADELFDFASDINNGVKADKCYRLACDMDLGGKKWIPAGMEMRTFRGVFDGNGKKITGLNVSESTGFTGLFGYNAGTIKNLKVSGYVTCTSTSDPQEHGKVDFVGGVAGFNTGMIEDVDSNVVVDAAGANNVGGIAGFSTSGRWVDARNKGDDEGIKKEIDGASGVIQRCSNSGFVAGRMKVGGIVGENAGTVDECYNKGTVVNMKTYGGSGAGGIAGRNGNNNTPHETGIITNCYNAGTVVLDCYNTGTQKDKNGENILTGKWAGGISGFVSGASSDGTVQTSSIENSYVCGALDVDFAYGDWAPLFPRGEAVKSIKNCYTLEGLPVCDKSKNNAERIGNVKTEGYMKSDGFASDLGNSFAKDTENLNGGYPVLHWQSVSRQMPVTSPKAPDPGKVTGLKVKSCSTSSLTLKWTKNPSAEGYVLEQYKSGGYKAVKTLSGAGSCTYTVSKLTSGSGYKFRVKAYSTKYGKKGYGSYSSVLSAPVKPGKVTLSKLKTGKSHYVTAYWKKKNGTGYIVNLSTSSKFKSGVKTYKISSYKTLSKKMTKLKKGKKYYVRVCAYKTYGSKTVYGAYSSTKKIKCR